MYFIAEWITKWSISELNNSWTSLKPFEILLVLKKKTELRKNVKISSNENIFVDIQSQYNRSSFVQNRTYEPTQSLHCFVCHQRTFGVEMWGSEGVVCTRYNRRLGYSQITIVYEWRPCGVHSQLGPPLRRTRMLIWWMGFFRIRSRLFVSLYVLLLTVLISSTRRHTTSLPHHFYLII